MSTGDAPILTGESRDSRSEPPPQWTRPASVGTSDLRSISSERNVTRTAQVAGLPFVKVPDI